MDKGILRACPRLWICCGRPLPLCLPRFDLPPGLVGCCVGRCAVKAAGVGGGILFVGAACGRPFCRRSPHWGRTGRWGHRPLRGAFRGTGDGAPGRRALRVGLTGCPGIDRAGARCAPLRVDYRSISEDGGRRAGPRRRFGKAFVCVGAWGGWLFWYVSSGGGGYSSALQGISKAW